MYILHIILCINLYHSVAVVWVLHVNSINMHINLHDYSEPIFMIIVFVFFLSQRMSVLVRTLPSPHPQLLHAYVKGAPEMIKRLCVPETG